MTTRAESRAGRVKLRALLTQGRYALSAGRVKEAAVLVKAHPQLAAHLVNLLFDEDAGVSQRAADVLERVTARVKAKAAVEGAGAASIERVLAREKDAILVLLMEARPETHPKKLRWNLALMLGYLPANSDFDRQCNGPEDLKVAAVLDWYGVSDWNDLLDGANQRNYAMTWFGSQTSR